MNTTTFDKPMRWFLIKGLIRGTHHWHQFPQQMKRRFPNTEIYCLDIPGNGFKYHEASPLSVEGMASSFQSEFLKITDDQESKDNYILASSLGGMVALEWLRQYEHQFSGAILANSSLANLSPFYMRMKPQNYLKILKALTIGDLEKRERLVLDITSEIKEKHSVLAKKWSRYQGQYPVSRENVIRQITAASKFRYKVKEFKIPILVLNSLKDTLVDPRCSEHLASHLNAPLWTHPTAGHDLSVDVPEWILDSMARWLA